MPTGPRPEIREDSTIFGVGSMDCSAAARGAYPAIRTRPTISRPEGTDCHIRNSLTHPAGACMPTAAHAVFRSQNTFHLIGRRGPRTEDARSTQMNCMSALKVESGTRGGGGNHTESPHFGWREGNLSPLRIAATADFTAKRRCHLTREQHFRNISGTAGPCPTKLPREMHVECVNPEVRGKRHTEIRMGSEVRSRRRHRSKSRPASTYVTVTKQGKGTGWERSALSGPISLLCDQNFALRVITRSG